LVDTMKTERLLVTLRKEECLLVNGKPKKVDCFISKHEGLGCVRIVGKVAQHVIQPKTKTILFKNLGFYSILILLICKLSLNT